MGENLLQLSYTLGDIDEAVVKFWEALRSFRVFAFSGEMGAGKTTFIHHLCACLRVEDAVSSPTFALVNEYHFADDMGKDNTIFHLDWYRLKDTDEAINAGMEDCIDQAIKGNAYCFIEWPERAMELLPVSCLWISITSPDMGVREMIVSVSE